MIYWVFISPDAFERLAQQVGARDGLDDLRELLFPRRADSNVLLADTHQEHWFKQASQRAWRLPPNVRGNALALLMQIEKQALAKLPSDKKIPKNEEQWIRHSRLLVDTSLVANASLTDDKVDHICKLQDDDWFRTNFATAGRISRALEAQERLFKRLFWGSSWCLATMPRVFGGSGDETVTLKQLVRIANSSASGKPYEIDIVTRELNGCEVANVRTELEECRGEGGKTVVRIYSSAQILDRNFYTGTHVTIADDQQMRVVVRGLFAQHVAISRDQPGQKSNWALLNKRQAEDQVNLLRKELRGIGEPVIMLSD